MKVYILNEVIGKNIVFKEQTPARYIHLIFYLVRPLVFVFLKKKLVSVKIIMLLSCNCRYSAKNSNKKLKENN